MGNLRKEAARIDPRLLQAWSTQRSTLTKYTIILTERLEKFSLDNQNPRNAEVLLYLPYCDHRSGVSVVHGRGTH